MSWWEDWFRPWRRGFPFGGFLSDNIFTEMDKMMENMFKEVMENVPKQLIREQKLPDGSTTRQMGPFVYGYSMTVGPDGKPVIREFGNVKPSMRPSAFGPPKPGLKVVEEREPLVDTIVEPDAIRVVAELPGVEKADIELNGAERSLTISVDTEKRKYYKEVDLPEDVDPDSAKASYNNGVLEVRLAKLKKSRSKPLKVE